VAESHSATLQNSKAYNRLSRMQQYLKFALSGACLLLLRGHSFTAFSRDLTNLLHANRLT
jgi:hypothetical protein